MMLRWLVLGGAVLLGCGAARGQGELDYTPRIPRPVNAEGRELLGYPPPRDQEVVLAALDALTAPAAPNVSPDDPEAERVEAIRAWRGATYDYHLAQVNLISELEEGGYTGERLDELIAAKVVSVGVLQHRHASTLRWIKAQSRDMQERHPAHADVQALKYGAEREWFVGLMQRGVRLDAQSLEKIAQLELAMPHGARDAGAMLKSALYGWQHAEDQSIYEHWAQWILDNLPEASTAVRTVRLERCVGTPLRIEGVGFDGERIDTAEWLGDVVLVDCWGMWCGPCLAQMPEVKALHDKYAERGLRVVGVLADWQPEKARAYLAQRGYDWPQIVDPGVTSMDQLYRHAVIAQLDVELTGFPTVHIIDRKGIQRTMYGVAGDLEAEVLRWLEEPAATAD